MASLQAVHANNVVLQFNQWLPEEHSTIRLGLQPWFKQVTAVTEGRVTIVPSVVPLATPGASYQAVVDGRIDVHAAPHSYDAGRFPLSDLVEQSFSNHNVGASSAAYWEVWEKHFKATGMHDDVVVLAMYTTAGSNIHMRFKPVTSMEDLLQTRMTVSTHSLGGN